MKLAINIYKTKRDLAMAIRGAESFSIEFESGPKFFCEFDNEDGTDIPVIMQKIDDSADIQCSSYVIFETFVTAIWRLFNPSSRNYGYIKSLRIDRITMDLDKMEKDAVINEAKGQLNATQIKDRSLGLIKVTRPLQSKLVLEGNENLIEMGDVLGDFITDLRASESYGTSKWTMDNVKINMAKMRKAMKALEAEIKECPTSESVRKSLGI